MDYDRLNDARNSGQIGECPELSFAEFSKTQVGRHQHIAIACFMESLNNNVGAEAEHGTSTGTYRGEFCTT